MPSARRFRLLGVTSLSLALFAGCQAPVPVSQGPNGPSVAEAGLSAEDQELLKAIRHMAGVAKQDASDGSGSTSSVQSTGSRYGIQAATPIEAQITEGFYVAPFPAASSLPAGYQQRPVGGWLTQNPKVTVSGPTTTTETWYTPNGDTTSAPAYTKTVVKNGATLTNLFAAPEQAAVLPSFFADKLTLSGPHTVAQAEETYLTYSNGPMAGTATGYRWSVKDGAGKLVAWIEAQQVTKADGTKSDFYEIHSDYQMVSESFRPVRYRYGTYHEATRAGQEIDQVFDPQTGKYATNGAWKDTANHKTVGLTETVNADGSTNSPYHVMTEA